MEHLQVKNWAEHQHYKDRNPPWIKLYHALLDDYEYTILSDASKLLLISFYLLASRTDNKIPHDLRWIKNKSEIRAEIDIQELLDAGFITVFDE